MGLQMMAEELQGFLAREVGQVAADFTVEQVTDSGLTLRLRVEDRHLRPGGTV